MSAPRPGVLARGEPQPTAVHLTPTTRRLLAALRQTPGRPVGFAQLQDVAEIRSLATLRVHMSKLRAALGDDAVCLQSVRGFGYRWNNGERHPELERHDRVLDVNDGALYTHDLVVGLTRQQALILQALTTNQGHVVDTYRLLAAANLTSTSSLAQQISALRCALAPVHDSAICNMRDVGYQYFGAPVYHATRAPCAQKHIQVDASGQLRIHWHLLRLRNMERAVLRVLLEHLEEPVPYEVLLQGAGTASVPTMQSAITTLRAALRPSDVRVVHGGPTSDAYILTRTNFTPIRSGRG